MHRNVYIGCALPLRDDTSQLIAEQKTCFLYTSQLTWVFLKHFLCVHFKYAMY